VIVIRNLEENDIEKLLEFVKNCKPLTEHTLYTYWVLSRYFPNICFLCENESRELIGAITGVISAKNQEHAFIWQIGVRLDYRRKGIATSLIDKFVNKCTQLGISYIEFTIEPNNVASFNLFKKYAGCKGIKMKKIKMVKTQLWKEVLYRYELK